MTRKQVTRYVGRVRDTGAKPMHGGKAFRVRTNANTAGQFATRKWAEDAIAAALRNDRSLERVGVDTEKITIDVEPKWQDHLRGDVVNPSSVPMQWRANYVDSLDRLTAAAIEYGEPIYVNESFRTRKQQEHFWAIYKAGGALAARPGTSDHERGLSFDIPNARSNKRLIKILRKRGLRDDVASEGWHVTNVARKK